MRHIPVVIHGNQTNCFCTVMTVLYFSGYRVERNIIPFYIKLPGCYQIVELLEQPG